jgi:peptidoglycan hydrolase-like protein with peptidoglycan-binding domain
MSGCPRDLAALDPWNASLERSRARRARAARGRARRNAKVDLPLSSLLEAGSVRQPRDLADEEPWHLSLGRSRARRRAAQLRFVPASSRAKRISLGALAAFSVGPAAASLASGQTSASPSPPRPEPATTTEHAITLSFGSEGRQVRLLQRALGDVKVDGVFGPETEEAVRGFQTSHGLGADGVVGPLTSAALRDKTTAFAASLQSVVPGEAQAPEAQAQNSSDAVYESESSASGASGSPATLGLEAGSSAGQEAQTAEGGAGNALSAGAVKQLQSALHLKVDGEFGPETEAAVMRLQERHGLAVDGVVGPQTWNVVGVRGQETLTPPASALPASGGEGEAAGSEAQGTGGAEAGGAPAAGSAAAVEQLQNALHLPVDGEFGPETEAAVMRLQARHGLAVDGVVGPDTWSVIGMQDHETLTPPPAAVPAPAGATEAPGEATGAPGEAAVAQEAPAPEQAAEEAPAPEQEAAPTDTAAPEQAEEEDAPAPQETAAPQQAAPAPSEEVPNSTSSAGSGDASGEVSRVIAAGNEIATRPYVYGGGHGSFESDGYDCSGSVSYALHGAGLINTPEDSSQLESYGESGPGKYITIYANSEHAYMVVDGKRFDTVALAEGGSRWSNSSGDDGGQFVARHPAGL